MGRGLASKEDGDFIELKKIRNKRKKRQHEQKTYMPKFREPDTEVKEQTTTPDVDRLEEKRKRLFSAVDKDDSSEVTKIMKEFEESIGENITEARDPDTDMNVLHYAALTKKVNVARTIIENCQEDLLLSHHKIEFSGVHGQQSTLHIFTMTKNIEMAKMLLEKINTEEKKKNFLNLETALNMPGFRRRLFSCLHLAAFYGIKEMIDIYLKHGMEINHTNEKNDTPLLWASCRGHTDVVEFLLEQKADTELCNDKGSTALHWAIRYNHPKIVKLLLNHNANPNTQRQTGLVSPIIIASAYGLVPIVELLLEHPDTDVNKKIRGGEMAIHHAAKEGCLGVIEKLVEKNVNINETDDLGDTPLLHATKNGHADVVGYLIMEGADPNHKNLEGHDSWYYAIKNKEDELLETLAMVFKNSESQCKKPLFIAANNGKCEKLKLLLKLGLNQNSSDAEGNTFLHHAAMNNQVKIIEQFHEIISINVQNNSKNTPLHIACLNGHCETVHALLKCKAKANVMNDKGETALHAAAKSMHITADCVKELVDYTIKTHTWESLNATDFIGNNCLHIAGKFAKPEVIWEFRQVRFKDRDADGLTPLHESVRPGEPEALDKMLDIFEIFNGDAKINEKSYEMSETVLHLAADEGHVKCIQRLIHLGADLSITDTNGDTVLHRLTKASVGDAIHIKRYIEVLEVILRNVVKWWCIKENKLFPEKDNAKACRSYKKDATLFLVNEISNKDGLSVMDQAFKSGASHIINRLLMMPGVTMFKTEKSKSYTFDVTGLTPRTSNGLQGCCGVRRTGSNNDDVKPRLSGIEWLVANNGGMQTAQILDIPPITMIENYYTSMVARIFALLMILHIIYMSVFTYIGVILQVKLRDDATSINNKHLETILLYVFVPLEPLLIIIYVVFLGIRYLVTRDFDRRSRLSKRRGISMVLSILASYFFILICFLYAILVFAWIGLFTKRYRFQDYVLAAAILIGWLLTIAFTRGIKITHYFYKMVISMIVKDIVRFIIVYLFVIMAFGFAFHILFQVSKAVSDEFSTPIHTLFLTFNMMVGMDEMFNDDFETNMEAVDRTTAYIKVYYLLYIILATVILLNLLIAMMNDSYQKILKNNKVLWRIESVGLGIEMESSLPPIKVFTDVKLSYGNEDTELDVSDDRWYVTVSSQRFQQLLQTNTTISNTQDSVIKHLEKLQEHQLGMEKETKQELKKIKDLLERREGMYAYNVWAILFESRA